jgi:CspA family cold shock protein
MSEFSRYNWAQALYSLACSPATDLNDLAVAATLDPKSDDFSDVDFSGLDLSGQNLTGWNLQNANLKNAIMRGAQIDQTDLQHAIVEPEQLIQASGWENARLNEKVRNKIVELAARNISKKGVVKWYNPTKGFGFIIPDGGDKDVFVHISAVERAGLSTLTEGQHVEYELVTNRGKSSAENLKIS